MENISKVFNIKEKLACITLDFEMDYGDRINDFNILKFNEKEIFNLAKVFLDLDIPISAFIRTDLLTNYSKSLDVIEKIAKDYHSHSHTHNVENFDNKQEISNSVSVFEKYFGYQPIGYRSPQGVLNNNDVKVIENCGFKFSSSVFPSFRPGKFNNLSIPISPFIYENNIIELPFSVVPKLRYVISLTYLKLLGLRMNNILFSLFGLPNVIIFDSHLHDYIINEKSFNQLPVRLRLAWGRNKYSGVRYFKNFIKLLKGKKYKFITMTDLYNRLKTLES